MNKDLYLQIFKRKSFHTFKERNSESISSEEIDDILNFYSHIDVLDSSIKTAIQILPAEKTTCKRNEEYCILFFSEKKDNYLQNIGYIGEQLDLYLTKKNIGTLWFGIAKHSEKYNDLDYVIMMGIAKVDEDKFRKDMYKSKRKSLDEIWSGESYGVGDIARFSPSACNSQPWFVESKENIINVYRKSKSGKVGIMPKNASVYYNQIDIGIFMCILEICLKHENIEYSRQLFIDKGSFEQLELNASYMIDCLQQ